MAFHDKGEEGKPKWHTKETVIKKLWFNEKSRFEIDDKDDSLFNAVVLTIDENSGKCEKITPIYLIENHI